MEKKPENPGSRVYYLSLVREVVDGQTIRLKDGRLIRLRGVKGNSERTVEFIKVLIGKNPLIVVNDNSASQDVHKDDRGRQLVYVYVWGVDMEKLPAFIDRKKLKYYGFLNVKKNWFSYSQKGLGLFLNATLVSLEIATIDDEFPFISPSDLR